MSEPTTPFHLMRPMSERKYAEGERFALGTGEPNPKCPTCFGGGYYMGVFGEPTECGCLEVSDE